MKLSACVVSTMLALSLLADDFSDREDVESFVDLLVSAHEFDPDVVRRVLAQAEKRDDIIELITRPAERKPWVWYRGIFVTPTRIEGGVEFIKQHRETLERAEDEFGVPKEIVTAIIGVETNYGKNKGSHRVLDALATLGFDYPPRAEFFRSQLEELFVLACEEQILPFEKQDSCKRKAEGKTLDTSVTIYDLVGSYAGAMGYGQFIPSSYRNFAIDFNADGRRDIWNDVEDAIGSVAAYFHAHDWVAGGPLIDQVEVVEDTDHLQKLANDTYKPNQSIAEWRELGVLSSLEDENQLAALFRFESEEATHYYLGYQNFYVITRYNISRLYAMAIKQVAEGIRHGIEIPD